MIKEDYVSFEVAKLLKKKGFDEICRAAYTGGGKFITHHNYYSQGGGDECVAPTHQMTIKWLREVHNIFIDVHLSFAEDTEAYPAVYYVYILDSKSGNSLLEKAPNIGELNPLMNISDHNIPINFDSSEEAAEAAIKYCLKNLI